MKAQVTVYVNPDKRKQALNILKSSIPEDIFFYSDQSPILSWIGETNIDIADQSTAYRLERELQKIPELSDVEITVDDPAQEDDLNLRFAQTNTIINEGKTQFPHPAWYRHAIKLDDALQFAEAEFKSGRGFFDPSSTKFDLALIDTGYSKHPEINGIDTVNWRNFMPGENPKDPLDSLESTRPLPIAWGGHGTSCSGLIMGRKATIPAENRIERNNAYYDDLIDGILPENLNVVHFRVSRNIISFASRMPAAISHIVNENKIKVISMSHATLFHRKSVYAATRAAYENGIILIAAPGSHVFASRKVFTYPAKYKETLAPAASTINNLPWRLTHGGPEVDLCAPGFEIYIPWPFKRDNRLGYAYKWSEGSSFAVPIVACAASLWNMHHGERLKNFSPIEQVELFRLTIKKTATAFAGPVDAKLFGAGIINFLAMLQHPLPNIEGLNKKLMMNLQMDASMIFRTNKKEASFKRELAYWKVSQFTSNQAKAVPEMDFYNQSGTSDFKNWINKRTGNKPDKIRVLNSILESSF